MDTPGCIYNGNPFSFYVASLAGHGQVSDDAVDVLLGQCEGRRELQGAKPAQAWEGGFAWPGDAASCEFWHTKVTKRPFTESIVASWMHDIRNQQGWYMRGSLVLTCSEFRCKFGTPLRKMVALVHLMEDTGYRILGTSHFIIDADGNGVVKKGEHPRVLAPELRRILRDRDANA